MSIVLAIAVIYLKKSGLIEHSVQTNFEGLDHTHHVVSDLGLHNLS